MPRDGRYLEKLGTYNPLTTPKTIELNEERVRYWVGVGAKPSDTVSAIIDKQIPSFIKDLEEARKEKIRSRRAARKQRAKK